MARTGGYGIWVSDHLAPQPPDLPATPIEAFSTLGALAAQLRDIRLGTLVSPMTYRPAAVLASFAHTLKEITGGRFVLGVGLGGTPEDHQDTGLPVGGYPQRLQAVREGCALIRRLLREWPARSPDDGVPLLIGGLGPATLRLVGALADEWIAFCDPAGLAAAAAAITEAATAAGRPPDAVATGAVAMLLDDEVPPSGRERLPAPALGLDDGTDVQTLRAYRDAGARELVVCDHRIPPDRRARAWDHLMRLVGAL